MKPVPVRVARRQRCEFYRGIASPDLNPLTMRTTQVCEHSRFASPIVFDVILVWSTMEQR